MKKVVLIGDSIRMGYDKYVKEALKNSAEVYYPGENCRFAEYVLRYAHEWKKAGAWGDDVDLVHWNAGLWDVLELFGDVLAEGVGVFGDDMEGHSVAVVAEQQPYAFFKDIHLDDGEKHASQVTVNEVRATDDDIAHNADNTLNVHMAMLFMEHRRNNVRSP